MIIQHNIMAINSHRQLGINNSHLSGNLEKLSSGYRINRALIEEMNVIQFEDWENTDDEYLKFEIGSTLPDGAH